jgi:SAM-dependent methyltransferase
LGVERPRLERDSTLELVRSQELLERFLPPPPSSVLDVGGGPGVYSAWLAARDYAVRLVDPVPLHITEALALAQAQPEHPFEATLGDARNLDAADASYDSVLLMGPLYHLIERDERLAAVREAGRVVRSGGRVIGVGISRFASLLDGLRSGWLGEPSFHAMLEQDLRTGVHRNPQPEQRPEWFTTAYLHRPHELAEEFVAAELIVDAIVGIEGPGWLISHHRWAEPQRRAEMLEAARAVEQEPSLLGASGHLMIIARRP